MRLVPVEDIRTTLGFEDMPDINDAIDTALTMATEIVARHLDTTFGLKSVEDVFYAPPYLKPENDGFVHTVLRLSHGFVAGAPVVEASYDPSFTDPVVVTTMKAESALDREKGILKDYQTNYTGVGRTTRLFDIYPGPYIRVRYGAGFLVDPQDPKSYLPAQVPSWLQELAKMQALMLLSTNPIVMQAQVTLPTGYTERTFSTILSKYLRFYPSALIPLYSKEV